MHSPHLARITIYPVKSLDGHAVSSVRVLASGALEADRRWALVDADGRFVNGKRTARVHALRTLVDVSQETLSVHVAGTTNVFHLNGVRQAAESWLSEQLGVPLRIVEDRQLGWPDDTEAPGPTVISTATVETVAGWFDLPPDEVRRRFRANLEIGGVEPFWEDRLYGAPGATRPFSIRTVPFLGVNPCQRCVVPTRDAHTGAVTSGFTQRFSQLREATLPSWVAAERFNHFYRLAVNTRPGEPAGGQICVGDPVTAS